MDARHLARLALHRIRQDDGLDALAPRLFGRGLQRDGGGGDDVVSLRAKRGSSGFGASAAGEARWRMAASGSFMP
jgi:hypothetical protein